MQNKPFSPSLPAAAGNQTTVTGDNGGDDDDDMDLSADSDLQSALSFIDQQRLSNSVEGGSTAITQSLLSAMRTKKIPAWLREAIEKSKYSHTPHSLLFPPPPSSSSA